MKQDRENAVEANAAKIKILGAILFAFQRKFFKRFLCSEIITKKLRLHSQNFLTIISKSVARYCERDSYVSSHLFKVKAPPLTFLLRFS